MSKNQKKSAEPTRTTGVMKKIDGIVVMMPPEEEESQESSEVAKTFVEKKDGVVAVSVEEDSTEEIAQHVTDSESEEQSREQAQKVREENQKVAQEASIETTPKKVGSAIVAHTEDSDTDWFAELEKAEKEEANIRED